MLNSPWRWLHEAVHLLAERLATETPGQYKTKTVAAAEARKQILDQAHRGALRIEGKRGDPQESEPQISQSDWELVPSSIWGSALEKTTRYAAINLIIIWETNCLSYEEQGIAFGFYDLKVRIAEFESIWPPQSAFMSRDMTEDIRPRNTDQINKGGRPPEYKTELLAEIERIAKSPEGIPAERGALFRRLRKFSLPHWPPGSPEDGTIRYAMRAFRQKPSS